MRSCKELPKNYEEILHIDLQKNRKFFFLVNGLSIVLIAFMIFVGIMLTPVKTLFDMSHGVGAFLFRIAVLAVGIVLYVYLHEKVHGIFIRYFSKEKPYYGFVGGFAFAGSHCFFDKRSYLIIALSPIVLLGILLIALNCMVSTAWFWVVYGIQILNISGAAGDLFVTVKFASLPKNILVFDEGVCMRVYAEKR